MTRAAHKGLKTPGRRQLRVAEIIRYSLASLLQRFPLQSPSRTTPFAQRRQIEAMITVTAVSMSPDLKNARVYVRGFHTGRLPKDWLVQLRAERGALRSALNLELKFTPNLHFTEDESFTYADRIESLIAADNSRYYDTDIDTDTEER